VVDGLDNERFSCPQPPHPHPPRPFNRAVADGDAQAIAPILARDCVMLTGTDSAVIAGRNAQVKVW
jgi:hypothetical protein